jgi:hypothetical protein
MLGNPPWERIKLHEKEFFASRDHEIANAPNKAARDRMITTLYAADAPQEKRALGREWQQVKHASECETEFARASGRYPLTAFGDINTYAIFAETFLAGTRSEGRAGFIVPTGIATDNSTKTFFERLMSKRQLVSLYDFENREGLFSEIDSRIKFVLITLGRESLEAEFAFFLTRADQLADDRRRFTLSCSDIALINPNTRTCPIFRSQADAQLTKKIYRAVPILIHGDDLETANPWHLQVHTRIWHMTEDSGWFRNNAQLSANGRRDGSIWRMADGSQYVPLFEAKMVHQFEHRWATYGDDGQASREVSTGYLTPRLRLGSVLRLGQVVGFWAGVIFPERRMSARLLRQQFRERR